MSIPQTSRKERSVTIWQRHLITLRSKDYRPICQHLGPARLDPLGNTPLDSGAAGKAGFGAGI